MFKPQRTWTKDANAFGKRLFIQGFDEALKLRNVVCHEITHLCTAHLRLPMWLNEGVAMLAVDGLLERETVQPSTLDLVARYPCPGTGDYRRLPNMGADTIVYHYARGYWATRYLQEAHPDLLRGLLAERMRPRAIDQAVAKALGLSSRKLWTEINARICGHFACAGDTVG